MSLLDSPLSSTHLRLHPQRFEALLGLSVEAFDALFEKVYKAEIVHQKRRHRLWCEARVERMVHRYRLLLREYLVLTLLYLRQYPIQQVLAASFAISQSQVNRIIERMTRLLEALLPTPEVTAQAILAFVETLADELLETYGRAPYHRGH